MRSTKRTGRIKGTNLYLCPDLKSEAIALGKRLKLSLSDMAERGLQRVIAEQRRKERRAA